MERSKQAASAQWRPRKYVLVGMGAILAASTLIVVTSIILQPADIKFFVTGFSYNGRSHTIPGKNFTFNLTSNNRSHRAEVVYRYLLVSMQLSGGKPKVRKMSVAAKVTKDEFQPQKRNSTYVEPVEAIVDSRFMDFYSSNASVAIMVFAQAQFKVGFARSRVYNIRSGCDRIDLTSFITSECPSSKTNITSQRYKCSTVS